MVEEHIYYRYVGNHSQRQGYLGDSRMNMTLSHVRRQKKRREENEMNLSGGPKESREKTR